jgi:hypothetical protein
VILGKKESRFFQLFAAFSTFFFTEHDICDIWSNQTQNSFFMLTPHWIAKVGGTLALQLKSGSHCIPPS